MIQLTHNTHSRTFSVSLCLSVSLSLCLSLDHSLSRALPVASAPLPLSPSSLTITPSFRKYRRHSTRISAVKKSALFKINRFSFFPACSCVYVSTSGHRKSRGLRASMTCATARREGGQIHRTVCEYTRLIHALQHTLQHTRHHTQDNTSKTTPHPRQSTHDRVSKHDGPLWSLPSVFSSSPAPPDHCVRLRAIAGARTRGSFQRGSPPSSTAPPAVRCSAATR